MNYDHPGPLLDSYFDGLASSILDEEAKLSLTAFFCPRKYFRVSSLSVLMRTTSLGPRRRFKADRFTEFSFGMEVAG